ncbi:MAG: hypothetical protein L0387_28180 [Acidobacteria bacterium]|nr:hypothetical protein [Acidobacteriota bacterium]MCI0625479.1 hypothetical protein [Acidobacteriota bacterium]MCI0718552.1 hypothetical protein [Acidobacteriota bacterium]
MTANLWMVVFLGLMVLTLFLFVTLQHWTTAKQQQMSAEEFRMWFQENYQEVKADSAPQPRPGEGATRTRKASATTRGTSLPSENTPPIGKESF